MFPLPLLALLTAAMLAPRAASAVPPACERRSPPHTLALVELYTSEGCSSCPPADRWLAAETGTRGDERLVALTLHVDYWDYIGWRDPFAQGRFGERQRELSRHSGGSPVYTPEVFVGMRELRRWHDATTFARRIDEINRQPARADIALAMTAGAGSIAAEAGIRLAAGVPGGSLQGVLVLYEDGLVSEVRHGENRGATLRHARVVRQWSPQPLAAGSATQMLRQDFPLAAVRDPAKLGLAAFVQDTRTGEVLQAVAMPVCLPIGK